MPIILGAVESSASKHKTLEKSSLHKGVTSTPSTHVTEHSSVSSYAPSMPILEDQASHVQVAIRIRPMAKAARNPLRLRRKAPQTAASAWEVQQNGDQSQLVQADTQVPVPGRQLFTFDTIFEPSDDTETVYQQMGRPLVQAVTSGRHGTLFCYGQTGAGKTYTMQGLVTHAMKDLLVPGVEVTAQYVEIYNEQVRDLLTSDMKVLQLREGKDGDVNVNAKQHAIASMANMDTLMRLGNKNRTSATTRMNAQSSRSHALLRLTIESHDNNRVRRSVLNLVDLAGSENSNASGATGQRKKETGKINQSLLALSRVIQSLSLPLGKRPRHIGYRDSKLTRIMQPHLSGNACIAVLCCISPAHEHMEETRSTLKFAANAKRITVKPKINEVVDQTSLISALQKELAEARAGLAHLQKEMLKRQSHAPSKPKTIQTHETEADEDDYSPSPLPEVDDNRFETVSDMSFECTEKVDRALVFGGGNTPESFRLLVNPENVCSSERHSLDSLSSSLSERERNGNYYKKKETELETHDVNRTFPPPINEVEIMDELNSVSKRATNERLEEAQERVAFLTTKLEKLYDLVEHSQHALEDIQEENMELDAQNKELKGLLERTETFRSFPIASLQQQPEALKYAIGAGMVLFAFGHGEFLFFVLALFLLCAFGDDMVLVDSMSKSEGDLINENVEEAG